MFADIAMDSQSIQKYKIRILQLVFGLGFFALGLRTVRASMFGGASQAKSIMAMVSAVIVVLVLKQRYWLLFPFFVFFDYQIPGMPFDGQELSCLSVVGLWLVRSVLHRENCFAFDRQLLLPCLICLWIGLVFCLNPTGMYVFGASTIGGRFYFKIFLGLSALFAFSTLRFTERDARLFFWTMVVSCGANALISGLLNPISQRVAQEGGGDFEGGYFLLAFVPFYYLLFARYSLREIIGSFPRLLLVLSLGTAMLFSGKRRMLGTIALIPVFRVLLTKKEVLLGGFLTVFAGVLIAFSVSADGALFDLPEGARRTLSPVVSRYARQPGAMGLRDPFRESIRSYARELIREKPWFGRQGFAMGLEETSWLISSTTGGSDGVDYARTGSWHSTWYAFAADFGLPCMFLWALFMVQLVWYSFRAAGIVVRGVYLPTCCLYFIFNFFIEIAFSYTSGHSALTSIGFFSQFGCLLAIVRGYEREQGLVET